MGSDGTNTAAPSTIQKIAETFASRFIRENCTGVHSRERLGTATTIERFPAHLAAARSALLLRPRILFHPQLPSRAQSSSQHVLVRLRQPNVGTSHPSPTTRNGQEHLRQLLDKLRLQLRCEHQVAVTLVLRGERGEDPTSYTKVSRPHMRTFLRTFEA